VKNYTRPYDSTGSRNVTTPEHPQGQNQKGADMIAAKAPDINRP